MSGAAPFPLSAGHVRQGRRCLGCLTLFLVAGGLCAAVPIAEEQDLSVDEDRLLPLALSGSDGDGDALVAVIVALPALGTLYQTPDGVNRGAAILAPDTVVSHAGGMLVYLPPPEMSEPGRGDFRFAMRERDTAEHLQSAPATVGVAINPVNDPPQLLLPPPGHFLAVGSAWSWTVPVGTFSDAEDGDGLSYSIRQVGGAALPAWLVFDPINRRLATVSGRPTQDDAGRIDAELLVRDSGGSQGLARFPVLVAVDAVVSGSSAGCAAGSALAMTGDLALVGEPGAPGEAGRVLVLHRDDNSWIPVGVLLPAQGLPDDRFGACLLLDGTNLFVGAPGTGRVHCWREATGTWTEESVLTPDDGGPDDGFGAALCLAGDRLAVGSPYGSAGGVVRVWSEDAGVWQQESRLAADPAQAGDGFGSALAYQDGVLLVGSPGRGTVHPFVANGTQWNAGAPIGDPAAVPAGGFGSALAMGAGLALVGAPLAGTGMAHVLRWDGTVWYYDGTLAVPGLAIGARFGSALALDSRMAVVGSPGDGWPGGGAHIFKRRADQGWDYQGPVTARGPVAGDGMGKAVAVAGKWVGVGAPDRGDAGETQLVGLTFLDLAPIADDRETTLLEDEPAAIVLSGRDPEDAALVFRVSALPRSGTLYQIDADGACGRVIAAGEVVTNVEHKVLYQPERDAVGDASLSFTVSDGLQDSDPGRVRLHVLPVNDPPILAEALTDQLIRIGFPFSYAIPAQTFIDPDGEDPSLAVAGSDGTALPAWLAFDPAGRTLSGTAASGDAGLLSLRVTATDAAGEAVSAGLSLTVIAEQAVAPEAAQSGDRAGAAVAVWGGIAAVGAPETAGGRGALTVWRREAGIWSEAWTLTLADGLVGDRFGHAVAVNENRILVGAPGRAQGGVRRGAAYVYEFDGNAFGLVAVLGSTDAQDKDAFGVSVALNGSFALIGAWQYDPISDTASGPGKADLFGRQEDGTWTPVAVLRPGLSSFPGDRFGAAVDLDATWAVVGIPCYNTTDTGAVQLYRYDGRSWMPASLLVPRRAVAGDRAGSAVSLSGNLLLVGAPLAYRGGDAAGCVHAFQLAGEEWVDLGLVPDPGLAAGDGFGSALCVRGHVAVIGIPGRDTSGLDAGAATAYVFADNAWTAAGLVRPNGPGGAFGAAAALAGGTVVIGGPDTATTRGGIWFYDLAHLNHPPAMVEQVVMVEEGQMALIVLQAVDGDQDSCRFRVLGSPNPLGLPRPAALHQVLPDGSRGQAIATFPSAVTDPAGRVLLEPDPEGFGPGYGDFCVDADDGWARSAPLELVVHVLGVNDPPVLGLPAGLAVEEGADLDVAMTLSDPDALGDDLEVTLSAGAGLLSLAGVEGPILLAGDGQDDPLLRLRAPLAVLNRTLATLRYRSDREVAGGTDTVTVLASDLGHNGSGGALFATAGVSIVVAPVNDPPRLARVTYFGVRDRPFVDRLEVVDEEGDAVSLSVVETSAGEMALRDGAGGFRYTPAPGMVGEVQARVRAADARGAVAELPLRIVVCDVDRARPILTGDPPLCACEGLAWNFAVGIDLAGLSGEIDLEVLLVDAPAGLTLVGHAEGEPGRLRLGAAAACALSWLPGAPPADRNHCAFGLTVVDRASATCDRRDLVLRWNVAPSASN